MAKQFGNGLGLQLRSMPITMRVDKRIHDAHPELRDQQRKSVERQLQENVHALAEVIGELMTEDDTLAGIDRLRESNPELAKRLVTATFGIAVNTLHMVGLQKVLSRRMSESN